MCGVSHAVREGGVVVADLDWDNGRPFVIELRAVSFSYDGAKLALDDVSLNVREGERVAVLGRNGSGKSTLVRILGALQAPLQGACFVAGRDVRDIPFRELRRVIGLVFQNPESQIVAAVVEDDVAFVPENQGLPPEEIEERVLWALGKVGMLHKRGALVSTLSGGEKQRLAIAGALASQAHCLILDEPTAMLDPEGRFEVETVLKALHGAGTTLIQVTHQIEDVKDVERVLVLSEGRLLWQGRADDFWGRAESMGFALPHALWLAERLGFPEGRANDDAIVSALEERRSMGAPPFFLHEEGEDHGPLPFIQVRDLSFQFDEFHQGRGHGMAIVLEKICATVPDGGWLSIVGRTGSGKSTLAQHLNGLYRVQAGEILMRGMPLPQEGEELRALRGEVGLVFQCPEDQLFCPTVEEELAFAPANMGVKGSALEMAILDALDCVGLGRDFLTRSPLSLSGGERRLVAIASVVAAGPQCLVLDEPTAGLDEEHRERVLALLTRLRDRGRSVVSITHDLDVALRFSDRVLIMDKGRVLAEGAPRDVLPALMEAMRPEAWPDALRISSRLRERFPDIPLTWNMEELANVLGL